MPSNAATGTPDCVRLHESGELAMRVADAWEHLASCDLCGLYCRVDRLAGKMGTCRTADRARVSSWGPHHGEERPLRGRHGSGTIFFTRCTMRCVFCQNFDISQADNGRLVEPEQLADIMLSLQSRGCHNINLVTPTHVVPQILSAVDIAAGRGLMLPLVYNTGGYDSPEALALLDGVIDIYMPDMKYAESEVAQRYSKVPNYLATNWEGVREMHRQVGDLQLDASGIATRGLLIRHLVLPDDIAGSKQILRFISEEVSPDTYVNVMDQYRPAYQTFRYPELNRRTRKAEFREVVDAASHLGLWRLDRC